MKQHRRARCVGPLCSLKPRDEQLHPRGETVKLPDGRRFCTECARSLTRKEPEVLVALPLDVVAAPERPPQTTSVVAEETPSEVETGLEIALERSLLPAPTVQVDLGDPLAYTIFPDTDVPGWPLRRGRLSASALGTFMKCPEQFRRKQILGHKEPGSGAQIVGGAAHKAVEANYRHIMMEGTPAPERLWHEWLDAKFDKELEREGGREISWGKEGWGEKEAYTPDTARARAKVAAGAYIQQVSPQVRPLGVEEPFVTWVSGCPVPIVGSKDLVTESDVVDVKFGKAHTEVQPDWRLQGLVYGLTGDRDMAWHCVGWPRKDGTCTVHTPADSPGLRFQRSYDRYVIATELVRSTVQAIMSYTSTFGTESPWPANLAHTYACDFCSFRKDGTCAWWHRNVSAEDLL